MATHRSHHWTDAPLEGRQRRRTISNWCNYREPGGEWQASAPGASQAQGTPANWNGSFDFSHGSQRAPLQCFFRDAMDAGNRAMVGCRIADRPGSWLNLKALDCSAADAVVEDGGASVRWASLWPQTDLVYRPGRARLTKELRLAAPGHPLAFEFSLRLAPGHTLEFVDGGARVLDSDGTEVLRMPAPWAHDSSTTAPTVDGHQQIGVTLTEGASRRIGAQTYRVIRLELDADDLTSAVYPVVVDPTTTISGMSAIRDNFIQSSATTINNGGQAYGVAGAFSIEKTRPMLAIETASIPAGLHTGLTLHYYRVANGTSANAATMRAYKVAAANTWAEGTAAGAAQTGSPCWAYAAHATRSWAGSQGCGTSGTDYEADASPPSLAYDAYTSGPNVLVDYPLRASWLQEWIDGTNNGVILISSNETSNASIVYQTTEAVSQQLYFSVDYSAASAAYYAALLARVRR